MIDLAPPHLVQYELVLDPADPVRGEGRPTEPGGDPRPLAGRVFLGGPLVHRLTPQFLAADVELSRYVEEQSHQYSYFLVHLSLSFTPVPEHPRLTSAAVELRLSSTVNAPEPIALSMSPHRVTDTTQVQKVWRLGPQLSLVGVDASIGEVGKTVDFTEQEIFLQALRPLRSDPAWEFRRTRASELVGSHHLALVIRTARDAATGLSCIVTAGAKTPLLRRFRKELPNPVRLETVL